MQSKPRLRKPTHERGAVRCMVVDAIPFAATAGQKPGQPRPNPPFTRSPLLEETSQRSGSKRRPRCPSPGRLLVATEKAVLFRWIFFVLRRRRSLGLTPAGLRPGATQPSLTSPTLYSIHPSNPLAFNFSPRISSYIFYANAITARENTPWKYVACSLPACLPACRERELKLNLDSR